MLTCTMITSKQKEKDSKRHTLQSYGPKDLIGFIVYSPSLALGSSEWLSFDDMWEFFCRGWDCQKPTEYLDIILVHYTYK